MARASNPTHAREIATTIVRTLRDAGHTAYFAGGCVRDALLGLQPTDFDVATDATPPKVRSLFKHTAEVGAAFGVVLVHERSMTDARSASERITVEVATFRSDGPYTDSRRPDSVRFSDPPSDAARRDFTINALFLDPLAPPPIENGIIDFVSGLHDLHARVIRAVGDPAARLAEDHLRALRAIRFASRLDFTIDPATATAISAHASELRGVSRERIGEELRRMLHHPSRARALSIMQELAVDAPVLGEPTARVPLPFVESLTATLSPQSVVSPMLALAAWRLDRDAAGGTGLNDRAIADAKRRARAALSLSNDEADEFGAILTTHQLVLNGWTVATTARRKRWAGTRWFDPACRLIAAAHPSQATQIHQDTNNLQTDGAGLAPNPLITGDDLAAAGMTPGPAFRIILDAVYDAQLEGRVTTRDAAMELAAGLNV